MYKGYHNIWLRITLKHCLQNFFSSTSVLYIGLRLSPRPVHLKPHIQTCNLHLKPSYFYQIAFHLEQMEFNFKSVQLPYCAINIEI